jgi:hypothetical protein
MLKYYTGKNKTNEKLRRREKETNSGSGGERKGLPSDDLPAFVLS